MNTTILRWAGVLVIALSIGVITFAWKGRQPGGRTIERRFINGEWKTTLYEDESLPVRWMYTYSAVGLSLLGAGTISASFLLRERAARPSPGNEVSSDYDGGSD